MKKTLLASALLLAMGTTGASATTYSFAYSANPSGPFTLGCDVGGPLNSSCSVTFNKAGLGISGNPDLESGQIDNSPGYETLIINFAWTVVLESFKLGKFDRFLDPDAYQYSINGGAFSDFLTDNPAIVGQAVNSFAVRAFPGSGSWDNFTLKSFTVSSVPLPAGALLLGSAMGGLALLRRRNKKTAAA